MLTRAVRAVVGLSLFVGLAAAQETVGVTVAPFEFHGNVRELPQVARAPFTFRQRAPVRPRQREAARSRVNEALEPLFNFATSPMPSPIQNFPGLSFTDLVGGFTAGTGTPSDDNGDVGPNHYIQAVNSAYAIYSKTGTQLAAFTEDSIWSGFGTSCDGNSQGDPIVLHDQLADRWILTHFAFPMNSNGDPISPFYECIAVSKTSDPVAGGYWMYAVRMDPGGAGLPPVGTMNDYPKFGLWNDGCLYMSANEFTSPAGSFVGTAYLSFSLAQIESGQPMTFGFGFLNNSSDPFTMIPSNLLGTLPNALPAAGTPNYYVSEDQTGFFFEVRKFTPGPSCGPGGSLSAPVFVSQTSYTTPAGAVIRQPGTTLKLDSLGDELMQKVQYRKVGSAESLWVVHSVQTSNSSTVAPQWAQIDVSGGVIATTPVQQQIYRPDTTLNRWMGSIAADRVGNAALGYSTSNGTSPNFPSIAYSGRLVTDPLNNLPQSEVQLVAGSGSQGPNSCGMAPCDRWGDYTSMSVDPVDDCTFWYTNQYYSSQTNGNAGEWQTRIGSFKFPSCAAAASLTVTKMHTGNFTQGQQSAAYTVTVTNTMGAGATSGTVTLTDNLPSGLTLASMTGSGWSCASNVCTRGDPLAAGSSYPPITVTVNVASNASSPLVNQVSVSGGGSPSANASDSTVVNVNPPVLTIAKAHAGSFTRGQQGAVYTLTVSNTAGAGPTSGTVTTFDTLPAGLTLASMAGTGWSCASSMCTRSDALAGGGSYPPITVTVNVTQTATSPQVNQASVSGGGSGGASTSDSTTIVIPPSLSVAKTHAGNFKQGQQNAAYSVTVSNAAGAGPTTGVVTVTDVLPSGLMLTGIGGVGWTCGGSSCTRSDALAGGASFPVINVTVNVTANASSPQVNQATVTGGGSAGSSAMDSTTVVANPPVLGVVKTHSGNFMQGQQNAAYSVTVSNATGAGPTSGVVTVTDTLPSGLTLTGIGGAGWTCNGNGCTRSDALAGGASFPVVNVTVNVAGNATSPQVNTVSVSGGGSAAAMANDSTNIVPLPALSVAKTHAGSFVQGQQAAYTIIVSNGGGPSFGTVTVTDNLPAGLSLVSMGGLGWNCSANVCTRGDSLVSSASYPAITVTVNVAGNATSPQVNQVTLAGGGGVAASASDSTMISPKIGTLSVSHNALNYGFSGATITSPQTIAVNFTGGAGAAWTASSNQSNIVVAPASGNGAATFQVTVSPGPSGVVTVTSAAASGSPQQVVVNVASVTPANPFGSFDTPLDGTTGIAGAVPVTGWALDNIEVTKVDLWREPVAGEPAGSGPNGLEYIGDAVFLAGARPDVQAANPGAPFNYRAGWGYLMLTNLLPGSSGGALGNGTYKLHAIAHNKTGASLDLGTHTIGVDNAHASKPFGTIDTPGQGATASGSSYVNFGWALTQNPFCIPTDGSTITAFVDGVALPGHPVYNQKRNDIATTFPGLCNSNGAIGFTVLDTTQFANGVHTIFWIVFDNQGRGDGVGSQVLQRVQCGGGGGESGGERSAGGRGEAAALVRCGE